MTGPKSAAAPLRLPFLLHPSYISHHVHSLDTCFYSSPFLHHLVHTKCSLMAQSWCSFISDEVIPTSFLVLVPAHMGCLTIPMPLLLLAVERLLVLRIIASCLGNLLWNYCKPTTIFSGLLPKISQLHALINKLLLNPMPPGPPHCTSAVLK